MELRIKNRTEELKDFIMKGTSPFHVTAEAARKLKEGGYEELNFHCPAGERWTLLCDAPGFDTYCIFCGRGLGWSK